MVAIVVVVVEPFFLVMIDRRSLRARATLSFDRLSAGRARRAQRLR